MIGPGPPLLGELILRDYASPATSPENDLTLLAHLMDNFTLLVKSAADRPLSANEDWAAALGGAQPPAGTVHAHPPQRRGPPGRPGGGGGPAPFF